MKSNKHDHKATKKIKAWIFAIMLLLPFLFIAPTAFYYGFNEQAQAQERIDQEPVYYETNEVSSIDDLIVGNVYQISITNPVLTSSTTPILLITETENIYNMTGFHGTDGVYRLDVSPTDFYIYNNGTPQRFYSVINQNFTFLLKQIRTSTYIEDNLSIFTIAQQQIVSSYTDETYTMSITDSMTTAWTNTWSNPLFSWTNNSPFYTAMSNFTNVFGIDNMQIANLLTYIATITAIYIVFDIVIELFTYVTHLIPRSD